MRDVLFFISVPTAVVMVLACGTGAPYDTPQPPVQAHGKCTQRGDIQDDYVCTDRGYAHGDLHWVKLS